MDLLLRLGIVLALVVVGAVLTAWHRRRGVADMMLGAVDTTTGESRWPNLPDELRGGATGTKPKATWVIFTTPLCVSCVAVQDDLERNFPHHRVIKVDATERPDLADLYEVRRAPTTLVADTNGTIVERFVGPETVRDFIVTAEDSRTTNS